MIYLQHFMYYDWCWFYVIWTPDFSRNKIIILIGGFFTKSIIDKKNLTKTEIVNVLYKLRAQNDVKKTQILSEGMDCQKKEL